MTRGLHILATVAFLAALGSCNLLSFLFGAPQSLEGNWRSTGAGDACLTVSGGKITSYDNCAGTSYTITSNPNAMVNGAQVQIELTYDANLGMSVRTVYDLQWQANGTLTGTASTFLNGAPSGSVQVTWMRR